MDAFFSSLLGVDRWIPRALPESSHGHTVPGPARVRTRLRYRPNVLKCRLLSELHDDDGDTWRTAVARDSGRAAKGKCLPARRHPSPSPASHSQRARPTLLGPRIRWTGRSVLL